jgi:hypothetical protein
MIEMRKLLKSNWNRIAVWALCMALTRVVFGGTPTHGIPAANFKVVQNDTANSVDSVSVSTTLAINDLRVRPGSNRGDYNLQVGDTGTNDVSEGLVMVAVTQNGRDNGELENLLGYAAPAFDSGAAGYWAVVQDATSDRAEYNMDVAVGYFRYSDWLAGWARNRTRSNGATNNLFTGSKGLVLGTHFKGISGGRSQVDLRTFGIYSTNSGVLIVNHGKNEGNYANSVANPDGTWEVYVKDNFGSATDPRALEQDPAAFVFIPKTNTMVVSGKFGVDESGTNAVILIHSGPEPAFSVTQLEPGRYRLAIPGGSPRSGILITSMEGGYTNNFDNVLSYEADGNSWILESRDTGVYPPPLEGVTNEPVASFVYIPAATPGVSAQPSRTVMTTESGGSAKVSVALDVAPTEPVTVSFRTTRPSEALVAPVDGSAAPSEVVFLIFLPDNWNIPQSIRVVGVDDAVQDGTAPFELFTRISATADPSYQGIPEIRLAGFNVDNETSSLVVDVIDGLSTSESGAETEIQVSLSRPPTASVRVPVVSLNPTEAIAIPSELVFGTADWNVPQKVTLRGVDDGLGDGARAFEVRLGSVSSDDASYAGLVGPRITGLNSDNDQAGLVWSYNLPLSVLESSVTQYTLALGTQPDLPVVVQLSSSASNKVVISPTNLTFTSTDWKAPRVVTVTGVDNLTNQSTLQFEVSNVFRSIDPVYTNFNGTVLLPAVLLDNETSVSLPSGETFYALGMSPVGIDGQAELADPDAKSFPGGRLTIASVPPASVSDRLAIRLPSSGASAVRVQGDAVLYSETRVGSVRGGAGTEALQIDFNEFATVAAIQDILRAVVFSTSDAGSGSRTISVRFEDGLGSTTLAEKIVRIGRVRQLQFQEGADHGYGVYSGAADIALSQVGSDLPWPEGRTLSPAEGLLMDWPDGGVPNESQILLRFDGIIGTNAWQIPPGAKVLLAEMFVYVNNPGDGAKLHRMLIPWDASQATWNSMVAGVSPDDVEARSTYDSQLGLEDGSGGTGLGSARIGVTADVQAWVSGQTNHGWVFLGWPLRTDGTGISPSEYPTISQRPRLRVLWTSPDIREASFQQGVGGYSGTRDTLLQQVQADVVLAAGEVLWADWPDGPGTNTMHSLLRFDDLFGTDTGRIPPTAQIHLAYLDLPSVGPDNMGDGARLHPMAKSWDDAVSTWNSWVNGIQADGIEADVIPSATIGNASLEPDVQATVNSVEVTSDLRAWQAGRPNYGWAFLPFPGGSNGWGFRSSEFVSFVDALRPEADRPKLRVYYTVAGVAVAATLQAPTVEQGKVRITWRGSPGASYRVVRSASLSGSFESLGVSVTDASGSAEFTDTAPVASEAYYRVVAE